MPSLFANDALLPSGWARDVLLEWDENGVLTRVEAGADDAGAPRAAGPVLPGMSNVHSHAFQRAMAGLAEWRGHPTDDFWTWREAMYDLVRRVEPDDLEAIAAHLYIEMLKHGYTAVGEFHYLHHRRDGKPHEERAELAERIVAAADTSGIALTLLPVLYAYGGFGHRALDDAQRRFRGDVESIATLVSELATWHAGRPAFRIGIAPHSVRAVDAMMLTQLVAAANDIDPGMPIHMHLSEQTGEVEACRGTHGVTPFAWIADLVDVDDRWCFIHSTHVTPDEMRGMAARGASVGLCPVTESNLGDGIRLGALPLLALRLTSDARLIGAVTALMLAPWFLLGPLAGAMVDRGNRRQIMLIGQFGRAVLAITLAGLVIADTVSIWALFIVGFGLGAGEVFVSRTVRDLVVGSDLHFEDRGTHELKGVPDSWQLYEAVT